MKIVIIGGTGLIGTKLGQRLRDGGHEVFAAAPASGVDILTGAGLDAALAGKDVVVDVSNSPSFEDAAVLSFFETSARNVLPAEARAGIKHHIALSVVGDDRMGDIGYMRAKIAQEKAIKASQVPYTIVRATQFFEFIGAIANTGTVGDTVRLPYALMQPIAANDVATLLAEVVVQAPLNDTIEIAGPESIGIDEFARRLLRAKGDPRLVEGDSQARYFGGKVDDRTLRPGPHPRIGPTRFGDWLGQITRA
ncbi:MAG TPA: NAD(P)H-binding protein [Polyangia bacterium]